MFSYKSVCVTRIIITPTVTWFSVSLCWKFEYLNKWNSWTFACFKEDIGCPFSTSYDFFRVFMKCLEHTLVKIPQWLCKTTPFLPCQKHLCSQRAVSVHVSLNANELCLPPPLSSVKEERRFANNRIKFKVWHFFFFWSCSWITNSGYWSILKI